MAQKSYITFAQAQAVIKAMSERHPSLGRSPWLWPS